MEADKSRAPKSRTQRLPPPRFNDQYAKERRFLYVCECYIQLFMLNTELRRF